MVSLLKYIGHYMRTNILTKENIKNQLFFFSKEALQNIVMNSKCGIITAPEEIFSRNASKNDINIFSSFSPLLCIYKKANCKLLNINGSLAWNEDKFKKEICVTGNIFMTLNILELSDYLKNFKEIDYEKYKLSDFYTKLAHKQLDFYISNFRNNDGLFVDKKDISDFIANEIKFEDKNKKFDYADQALIMAAFYKYSLNSNDKFSESFKNYSLEILNMFLQYKEELYEASLSQITKLCLGLNAFCGYSNNSEAISLVIDLLDFTEENFLDKNLTDTCLLAINYFLIYKLTGYDKLKFLGEKIANDLLNLYDPITGVFLKKDEKKEIIYSCDEIILYLVSLVLYSENNGENKDLNIIIVDIYKHVIINSGIVSSWPEAPMLDNAERYENFSMTENDFLDDYNFRTENIANQENTEIASVFLKNVTYNTKKSAFVQNKFSFDSTKNMFIFFIILLLFTK